MSKANAPREPVVADLGEFGLIARIAKKMPTPRHVSLGIGDDAAVMSVRKGHRLVVTADLLVEDIHFTVETANPADLGYKSVAVNLSDLAAMGARATGLVLSLALPGTTPQAWADGFIAGVTEASREANTALIGGDTTKSPGPICINITALGEAQPERLLRRDGAKADDGLWLCGALGLSRVGLEALQGGHAGYDIAKRAHAKPQALLEMGRALGRSPRCQACIDISDGLLSDLAHLCERSRVGAVLERSALPLHAEIRAFAEAVGGDPYDYVLNGGEDYALLFTLSGRGRVPSHEPSPLPVRIGTITDQPGIRIREPDGSETPVLPAGWTHF